MDAAGSWPVQLTQSEESQGGLCPSPDGRTLLFTQDAGGNERNDVYSIPTTGRPVTQLTATPEVAEDNPRFSPDGHSVALEIEPASGAAVNIGVMDLATRKNRFAAPAGGMVREIPEAAVES